MKIYLDMDGVLCNFERRYFELYGKLPGSMRDRKAFDENWDHFVETEQFKTLEWWANGKQLIEHVQTLDDIEIEILSSSGGDKYHDEVSRQKKYWLESKNIPFKANIVSGRRNKSKYATSDSILIDDTYDVIQSFIGAGGIGIHHKDFGNTLLLLNSIVDNRL